jgi:hypothetical protein
MDTEVVESELVARLKRLDASDTPSGVNYGYDALIGRHAARQSRARRRLAIARGTASALVVALVAASVWRFDQQLDSSELVANEAVAEDIAPASQPRIVRADSYFAVAVLEDHIATLDEALNVARQGGGMAEIARLEKARAEMFDSYNQVRYAQLVSANF